jgi:dihydropyrimidinase
MEDCSGLGWIDSLATETRKATNMQDVDLLITGGKVVTALAEKTAHVVVRDGKVGAILDPDGPTPKARRVIDATGLYVVPGGIDPHTHIGGGAKVLGSLESAVEACTRALAFGGTTTVMEMISPEKGAGLSEGATKAREERDGHMAIDFAFHLSLHAIGDHVPAQLVQLAADGTPSFHVSFEGGRGEPIHEGSLHRLLDLGRSEGIMAIVHAEDPKLNEEMIRRTARAEAMENVTRCRPWFSETASVQRSLFVAELTRGPLYFEHLGAGPSLDLVRAARAKGLPAYAETCPHYLCFSEEIYQTPKGIELLKSPPLRRMEDCLSLWQGVDDGSISSIATDESLASLEDKRRRIESHPAYKVSGGLNQIELRMALMHTEMVVRRGMPLQKWAQRLSTGPALLFGLYPRKGTIEVGSDADLVLFDPRIVRKVRNEDLHQETDHTIFEGWELHGYPIMTILRGKVIVENGAFTGSPSDGGWLSRKIDRAVIEGPAV